jgi:hypothetical protein
MDKLTKPQRQAIRSLMQDGRFTAVELLKKILINEISGYQVKADTEFETVWRVAKKEAGMEVLEDFFKRMILEASKSDE